MKRENNIGPNREPYGPLYLISFSSDAATSTLQYIAASLPNNFLSKYKIGFESSALLQLTNKIPTIC